jgi:hypothetical protein
MTQKLAPPSVPCGGSTCLMSQMGHAVRTLSSDVMAMHETIRKVQPDSTLLRVQRLSWIVVAVLVSVATCIWLHDRLMLIVK